MSNTIHLIGNVATVITREEYTRADGEVLTKVRFLLAADKDHPMRADGTKRPADYVPVEAWGATARAVAQYQSKGSKLAVKGWLKAEFYRPEGADKDRLDVVVVADRVEFLGPRRTEESGTADTETEPAQEPEDSRPAVRPPAGTCR